jgi:uncharacterized membrane protein
LFFFVLLLFFLFAFERVRKKKGKKKEKGEAAREDLSRPRVRRRCGRVIVPSTRPILAPLLLLHIFSVQNEASMASFEAPTLCN